MLVSGDNSKHQLGIPGKSNAGEILKFTQMSGLYFMVEKTACAANHMLLLSEQNDVYAVGDNSTGNLGQGHKFASDVPVRVPGLSSVQVQGIAAGRHSAVVTQEGSLYVWGPALDPKQCILEP